LRFYWEKIDGDVYKRKVRLRWYAPLDGPPSRSGEIAAFLDVKDRIGAAREKRHVPLRADAALLNAAPLRTAELRELLERTARAAGLPIATALVPTLSIRYRRQRFTCPCTGARISLDSAIRSPRANPALFPGRAPLESGRVVCEVKAGVVREGPWAEGLLRLGFRLQSFSKYGLFMEMHLQGSV
ncbi:MAG TPA: VTC domain-containing protein, partial [Kiritimatiellia bacterium]|nr:VTC domain-containing protein [Kiritimatiellia bacterium]